jgi:hypothetical protein
MTYMDTRLLDRIAAGRAQEIVNAAAAATSAKDVDILVTKALGVLQEDGVYACFLYLFSRTQDKEKTIAQKVRESLLSLAVEDVQQDASMPELNDAQVLAFVSDTLCADLDRLLMLKEIFEQTLIYARYGAKARKNSEKPQAPQGQAEGS